MNQEFIEFRSEIFFYFRQECFLAKQLLKKGIVDIAFSNHNAYKDLGVGYGYSAFFNLSIGIERLEKLALIFYHSKNNSDSTQPIKLPKGSIIRNEGHDLMALFKKIESYIATDAPESVNLFDIDSISNDILCFLTDFAKGARYENLDRLSGSGSRYSEPLCTWENILKKIVSERLNMEEWETLIVAEEKIEEKSKYKSLLYDYSNKKISMIRIKRMAEIYNTIYHDISWYIYLILKPIIFSLNKWAKECYDINEKFFLPEKNKNPNTKFGFDIPETWEIFSNDEFFNIDSKAEFVVLGWKQDEKLRENLMDNIKCPFWFNPYI